MTINLPSRPKCNRSVPSLASIWGRIYVLILLLIGTALLLFRFGWSFAVFVRSPRGVDLSLLGILVILIVLDIACAIGLAQSILRRRVALRMNRRRLRLR